MKKHSPSTLIALDAVCSVASEEIRFDDWGLDIVISATQKGLGTPPGLSVCVISKRAVETLESRKAQVGSYYISWKKWLPIMKAYEEGRPMYFATRELTLHFMKKKVADDIAPVQLVYALHASLKSITTGSVSLEDRFAQHRATSKEVKDRLSELGFGFVPTSRDHAANGMTAARYPKGVQASDILPKLAE